MASADLTINVAVRTLASPLTGLVRGMDNLSNAVRRTMRTFRDFVIVGYGVRRAFDLVSRTITKTFQDAGGLGTRQLELLSIATANFGGRVGQTIQKTKTFQDAIKALTDAFRGGLLTDEDRGNVAKSIDRFVGGFLVGIGKMTNGLQQMFLDVKFELQDIAGKFGWFWGLKPQSLPEPPNLPNYLALQGLTPYKIQPRFPNVGPHDTIDIQESQLGMEKLKNELYIAELQRLKSPKPGVATAGNSMISTGNALIGGAGTGEGQALRSYGEIQIALFEEHIGALKKDIEGLGQAWVGVFNTFSSEAFDKNIGYKKAFANIGKNAGKVFVNQMSNAMFSPMQEVFNQIANLAAIPFRVIGHVLTDLIVQPITDLITKLLPKAVSEMLTSQTTVAAAGAANQAAATAGAVGAAKTVTAANAPAAAGAGIGSWGTALIFGGIALAIIAAASARFMAEGGVVMPRKGGVPAILAERGEPEIVLPLSKASEVLGGMGGSGVVSGVRVTVMGGLQSYSRNRSLARHIGRQIQDEMRSNSYGGRRDRRR